MAFSYRLWYKEIVGGVLAMSMDDFRAVNGYSNMYWAWGGEDDDMGLFPRIFFFCVIMKK